MVITFTGNYSFTHSSILQDSSTYTLISFRNRMHCLCVFKVLSFPRRSDFGVAYDAWRWRRSWWRRCATISIYFAFYFLLLTLIHHGVPIFDSALMEAKILLDVRKEVNHNLWPHCYIAKRGKYKNIAGREKWIHSCIFLKILLNLMCNSGFFSVLLIYITFSKSTFWMWEFMVSRSQYAL